MPMNLVIQEKRKELGLTQEQVAEYLNVSAPAVSKWETGTTSPDLALLPVLARLLKTDLNTLFCYQEDLPQQEIDDFCRKIAAMVQTDGLSAAFDAAAQKLREYPHSEMLLYGLAFQLDAQLALAALPADAKQPFKNTVAHWYRRLAKSADSTICNSANYMLAARYLQSGDYDNAQLVLDRMQDRNDAIRDIADKLMLQVTIDQHRGQADRACEALERALLAALNRVSLLLHKLVDAELCAGKRRIAGEVAGIAAQLTRSFDLWEYGSFPAQLQIALTDRDAAACIDLLRRMLDALFSPWDMAQSPLFWRIADTAERSAPEQMLPAILAELEHAPQYDFMRDCRAYRELLAAYWKKAGKADAGGRS